MEIWITRAQTGILVDEAMHPDELEAEVKGLEVYGELSSAEEVTVELTGRWEDIKQFFQDIQQLADFARRRDYEKDSEQDKLIMRLRDQKLIKL